MNKIKQIKFLQSSVVIMFILQVVVGIVIFIKWPYKLPDYKELISIIFPTFIAVVIPALIGKPLTEAVRNLTSKKTKE